MAAFRSVCSTFASQAGRVVLNSPWGQAQIGTKLCGGSAPSWWRSLSACNAALSGVGGFYPSKAPWIGSDQIHHPSLKGHSPWGQACWAASALQNGPPGSFDDSWQHRKPDAVSCSSSLSDGRWWHVGSEGMEKQENPRVSSAAQSYWAPPLLPLGTSASTAAASPSPQALLHKRHFSQGHRLVLGAKPKAAQGRALRIAPQSVNTVVEPYKKPKPLPLWRRWLTLEGWRVRKDAVVGYVKSGYAAAKVKRAIPGYTVPMFLKDVADSYLRINRALAAGDMSALRHLVTERMLSQMKQELDVRHKGGWATIVWDMPKPAEMKQRTVHGRLVGVNPKDTTMVFAQMTMRLQSQQKFAAYDRKGKLVAGDPNQELSVEDHWVFERPLWIKDAQWRLCGRLTL